MKTRILFAIMLGIGSLAQGQITLTFEESGSDLVVEAFGTFQVAATSSFGGDAQYLARGATSNSWNTVYALDTLFGSTSTATLSGDVPLMANIDIFVSYAGTGDSFGYETSNSDGWVYGPVGFGVSDSVSGSTTFTNVSFSDIGLGAGDSGTFFIGAQQFNWAAISPVPEPSTYALISMGVLGVCLSLRRRMQQTT